jgi:hypothetical protein
MFLLLAKAHRGGQGAESHPPRRTLRLCVFASYSFFFAQRRRDAKKFWSLDMTFRHGGLALRLPCFARQIFLLIFSSRKVGRLLKRLATCPPRRVISNAQRRSKNEEVGKTSLPIRRGGQVSRVDRPACRKQDTKDLMR